MSEKKKYFPVFIDLTGQPVLIIGAGEVASRRAGVLADFGAEITVIAPEGTEAMEQLEAQKQVIWHHRECRAEELMELMRQHWSMVLTATNDSELNQQATEAARAAGIPVNHAGDHSRCDFFFPAIIQNENLVIGVTSTNQDHSFVRRIAAKLRAWLAMAGV